MRSQLRNVANSVLDSSPSSGSSRFSAHYRTGNVPNNWSSSRIPVRRAETRF
ncbi:hypothetical protein [Saccharopolyspora shandongensis]|uniref:hypothetical protein n=1 Tax=Saccharopolyspora shandongensis TaxID=418495 RepID=UPI00340E170A